MKLDFTELEKGIKEASLEKEAFGEELYNKYLDNANPGWRERKGQGGPMGTSYIIPGLSVPINVPNLRHMVNRFKTSPEFSPETKATLGIPGQLIDTFSAVKGAVTGENPEAPKAPKAPGKTMQNMSAGIDRVNEVIKNFSKAKDKVDYVTKGVSNTLHKNAPGVAKVLDSAGSLAKTTWDNMGTMGHVATPLIGLGLSAILMHYFNKKKESKYPMGGGQPININIGGKPAHPMFNTPGVSSFGDFKYGEEKTANLVVDSLANAVKNRIANKVLDTAVPTGQEAKKSPSEKELEITSKYPEMAKLLEDDKNKAYLERLLKQ